MRFVHTADLHLGRRIAQMSLEEDLEHVLAELADLVVRSRAQALVVAGDVFDSSDPQEGALRQWDRLVARMAESGVSVLAVGGARDAGSLAEGSEPIARPGVRVATRLEGDVACAEVGGVNFWLIPFVQPADVRTWARELGISWQDPFDAEAAMRLVCDHIRSLPAFSARPNVVVAHQLVVAGAAGSVRPGIAQTSPGTDEGLEAVGYTCFDGFDYVALGYLHDPQSVGRDTCRYAGSPLRLAASETTLPKSFTVVGVKETEEGVRVKTKIVEVAPLRDLSVELLTPAEPATPEEERREDPVQAVQAVQAGDVKADDVPMDDVRVDDTPNKDVKADDAHADNVQPDDAQADDPQPDDTQLDDPQADDVETDDARTDDVRVDEVERTGQASSSLGQATLDKEANRDAGEPTTEADVELNKDVIDLFHEFFERETGMPLSSEQEKMVADAYARAARKGDE